MSIDEATHASVRPALEPCPGCGALFPPSDGPTHAYIGASAGCWALFAPLSAGERPDPALLAASRLPEGAGRSNSPARAPSAPGLRALVGDAYAVQHHGDGRPQAVQSVAVHLLTLHGILDAGLPVSSALWLRRRALRRRGVFRQLEPPSFASMLTLRHLFAGGGVGEPASPTAYVESVYAAWSRRHAETIAAWYAEFVVPD